jgi:arylsulfatase A-like enzyme
VIGPPPEVAKADDGIVYGIEFEDAEDPGLIAADGGAAPKIEDSLLKVSKHNGRDYLTNAAALAIPREAVGDIVIRAKASQQSWITLAWTKEDASEDIWWNRIEIALIGDDAFHTYVINGRNALRRGLGSEDEIADLFVKPANVADTDVEIDFIRFLSNRARYIGTPNGVRYETLDGEMRQSLYMQPDQTLEWSIDLPKDKPILEFGNGALLEGLPITFEIWLGAGGERIRLHAHTLAAASGWQDFRLDLSRWAGQHVALQLKVTGDPRNVGLWSNPLVHSPPKRRFNVIVLLEDALRADYLSSYGSEFDTSPNKTALMRARGVQFDWAFSQATKTRPSVPALMTSLYPTATGVWHRSDMLSERHLTLAEIMRSQGFVTASFLQNGNAGPYAGLHQGFSELYDERIMGNASEEIFGERVFSWLEDHRDQNFFLYLHVIDPHAPYDPPPPFDGAFAEVAGEGTPVPRERHLEPEEAPAPTPEGQRRLYAGEIRHNDQLLPTLLHKLDKLGITEDTLLVFLADHGEYLGEHGDWDHHPPSLLPVIHVPLMMTYPRRFKEPKAIGDAVQLIDVMPTIMELAEIDRTDLLVEGDSLVGLIQGQDPERWRNRPVIAEEPWAMLKENPCRCASVFHWNWHVVSSTWLWPRRGTGILPKLHAFLKTHVYQFRDDPKEESPRLSLLPDLYVRWLMFDVLSELQETNMSTHRKLTAGENVDLQLDPDTLEHLRGLGYVN